MKVYIIKQEWFNVNEGLDSVIIGVYDSLEKARLTLKNTFDEDIKWLKDDYDFDELEEEFIDDWSSFVQANNDCWCHNEIQMFELE